MIKHIWFYNCDTEYDRILFTYGQIANNVYQEINYLISPVPPYQTRSVYLPDIGIEGNPTVKEYLAKCLNDTAYASQNHGYNLSEIQEFLDKEAFTKLSGFIQKDQLSKAELKQIYVEKSSSDKTLEQIFAMLNDIFDIVDLQVVVVLTKYGTTGSSGPQTLDELKDNKFPNQQDIDFSKPIITLYIRIDGTINSVISMLIFTLIRQKISPKKLSWQVFRYSTDVIIEISKIKELLPNFHPSYEKDSHNRNIDNPDLIKISKKYFAKLKESQKIRISTKKDKIMIDDKSFGKEHFRNDSFKLLKLFINNPGKIISNHEIAHTIWGEAGNEKYSLWALSKKLQILREDLSKIGLPRNIILTKRGKGYILDL